MKKVDRLLNIFSQKTLGSQKKFIKAISSLGLGTITLLNFCSPIFAEGSQQLGSGDQGLNVYLFEYNAQNSFIQTSQSPRPIKVNVETAGEVINISLCGWTPTNDLAIEVFDPNGTEINYTTQVVSGSPGSFSSTAAIGTGTTGAGGWLLTDGNAKTTTQTTLCNTNTNPTAPTGNLSNAVRFSAPEAGTYEIRLYNDTETYNSSNNVFTYFDITVTSDTSINPNPNENQGRVWATTWAFNAGNTFTASGGYDADLYIRTPGGRPNTEYIWQLDLNNFAPQRHEIVANSIGLNSPLSRYSVPSTSSPSYTKSFPIYLSSPNSLSFIAPILSEPAPPTLSNLSFVDSAGEDNTISPNGNSIQDKGFFKFDADVTGTYEIVIDTNSNGSFGTGDRVLFGLVTPGTNSVEWDGEGFNNVTLGEGTYQTRISIRIGEYHFLTFDAETSGGGSGDGLSIWKWNTFSSSRAAVLNYWDDATYLGGTFPSATTNIDGALSNTTAGKHTWGNFNSGSLGDNNYLDTWVFGASQVVTTPAIIANSSDSNDFGDAPDTYGTNKDTSVGGVPASQIVSTTLRLGTNATDAETNGQPNATATGDDASNTDDEDGVTLPTLTTASTNYSATVSFRKNVTGDVYLVGWIDFNRNGTFEASEGVAQTLTNAASTTQRTTNLTWSGLSGISPGTTYARFRISKDPMTTGDFTGGGTYGEVEDYQLTISISGTDYGDAPDGATGTAIGNYQTTLSDSGARHNIVTGLRLGSQIDNDSGTLQNTAANADDNGTLDDEDGVTLPNTLTTESGQTYTVPNVSVTNSTASDAFLVGYIDFNQDGDFLDTGEKSATVTVGTNATNPRNFNVVFTTPTGIVAGNTYARFRLSNTRTQAESSFGLANSGEVEDYLLPISRAVSGKVWNDANGNIVLSSNYEGNSGSNVFNEVATNTGSSSLTVYAVDGSGNVVGRATVASNGTYKIIGLAANTNYTLRLSNDNSKNIGDPSPSVSLPTGWTVTGENKNGTTETTTPGEITIDAGTSSVINQDFGIFVPNANWNRGICTTTPDLMLILDDSSSVDATEVQQQRDAAMAMIDYFISNNTSARIAIVGFDSQKRTVINYTNVTTANRSLFVTALNTNYGVTGSGTNWPNGFQQAESLGLSSGQPDAVFFFTDGDSYGGGNAVTEANKFKVVGAHIYGIWIDDDTNLQLLDFQEITDGQNTIEFNGSNADVADYVKIDAYGQLAGNITTLIQNFCPINVTPPQLKLLKRITNVTRGGNNITPPNSQPFASFNEDGIVNNDDNNTKWPDSNSATGNNSDTTNDYLKGAINGGQVIKDDEIEYTIYFLNTGGLDAANVKLCDQIPLNTTFVPDAFGTSQGIGLAFNSGALPTTQNLIYTNDRTDTDKGKYFPAGVEPTGCVRQTTPNVFVPITAADNVNGTISVEIPLVPDTTGQNPFAPNDAYGFIRFRAKVNPQ
jgi:uncharacterized repeat protein (TIGR01451 family)